MSQEIDWKTFERLVTLLTSEEYDSTKFSVTPNALIKGKSGLRRQIDVLVEYRHDEDRKKRIIIDAKKRNRAVSITDVEAFEGLMHDVEAAQGYLFTSKGFTDGAYRRAYKNIGLRIVPIEDIASFSLSSWDECLNDKGCSGLILWHGNPGIIVDGIVSVQAIAKCDTCRRFHIWCWACGNKISMSDEEDWQCSCSEKKWFWLTAIEPDDPDQAQEVLLICGSSGGIFVVDAKPY